jgi:YD repeat-containing protein
LNRLTGITDALSGLTQFGYDANGNLLAVTDARRKLSSEMRQSVSEICESPS